ncbi:MAG: LysR family transcriptional regulator [Lachnospiraceae bacterium]|nr:LysR family transcriptional regulator [Lachnospiraceae bacterium]
MESVRVFWDVHRLGSITAAAEEHFMTQPALGKRIASLEKELGVTLFRRGKGQARAELTPEGKAFCDIAERMLLLNDQALELKNDAGKEYLTIASIRSAHDFVVPKLVLKLNQQHPNLSVTVEEHQTAEIIELLEKRRIDVGVIQIEAPSQYLRSKLLYQESYRVVVRSNSPLAKKESIAPEELQAGHGIFQVFDTPYENWFTGYWRPYSVKVRVNSTPTAVQYFRDDEDWMIVPEAVADYLKNQGFASIAIAGEVPVHNVYMCWNPNNRREAVQWLRDTMG